MISYFNSEHYPDVVPAKAILSIEREERRQAKIRNGTWDLKTVFICAPVRGSGDVSDEIIAGNISNAMKYCRFAIMREAVPLTSIYFTAFLDENIKEERELGICMGLQIIKKCNELWVFGSDISEGMAKEIEFAKKTVRTIRYFDTNCKEVDER